MLTEDSCPCHIIALHVGDGSRERAQQLWAHCLRCIASRLRGLWINTRSTQV